MQTRLPRGDEAIVPEEKLTGYLLNTAHKVGGPKARLLTSFGYRLEEFERLRQDLLLLAKDGEVAEISSSPYGRKYVVDGTLSSPTGVLLKVRTVWMVEAGSESPKLVTLYPL